MRFDAAIVGISAADPRPDRPFHHLISLDLRHRRRHFPDQLLRNSRWHHRRSFRSRSLPRSASPSPQLPISPTPPPPGFDPLLEENNIESHIFRGIIEKVMATEAASGGIFKACISDGDMGTQRRTYHYNCGCAFHDSRGCYPHDPCSTTIFYPICHSWSEGGLEVMISSCSTSPVPPSTAEIKRT